MGYLFLSLMVGMVVISGYHTLVTSGYSMLLVGLKPIYDNIW